MYVNKFEIVYIFVGSYIRMCGMYDVGFYGFNCKILNINYYVWVFKRFFGSFLN